MVLPEKHPSLEEECLALRQENQLLRQEIRVAREAAEMTADMVIEQFAHNETVLAQLRSTTAKLQGVLDAADQAAIIATNEQGKVVLCNCGAEQMLGYAPGEIVDYIYLLDLMPEVEGFGSLSSTTANGNVLRQLVVRPEEGTHRALFRRQDGSTFHVNLSVSVLHDNEGKINGYLSVAMDITPLQEAEARLQHSYEELQEANRHLQQLDQLKSDFLSSVSHELRTPLTSIRGFAKLISRDFKRTFLPLLDEIPRSKKKAKRIEDNLEIILSEAERLTRLINEVLDLAKIESGRMSWKDELLQVPALIEQSLHAVQGQFSEKEKVQLQTRLQEPLPPLQADPDRLQQVLVNLLNNAAKFTDEGSVTVEAALTTEGMIRISVRDTGSGFPSEEAEAVFDKFQQSRHGDTLDNKPKGTGLGLSICREIVQHYGGQIWAESTPGEGSTFSFLIPPAPPQPPPSLQPSSPAKDSSLHQEQALEVSLSSASPPSPDGLSPSATAPDQEDPGSKEQTRQKSPQGPERQEGPAPEESLQPRILVVDDDAGVRDYLGQLLAENDYQVITAANGKEALHAARRYKPHLITMDLLMPVMDGSAAIAHLREDKELSRIPVIVVSALSSGDQTGANLAMEKPIDEERLLHSVRLLLYASSARFRSSSYSLSCQRCLVVYADEKPRELHELPGISAEKLEYCQVAQLPQFLQHEFQGIVLLPMELLPQVDASVLQRESSTLILIVPVESEPPLPPLETTSQA